MKEMVVQPSSDR